MNKFVSIVKHQVVWFQEQAARFTPEHPRYRPDKVAMYERLARDFGELAMFLAALPDETSVGTLEPPKPAERPAAPPVVVGTPADLSDLPPELLEQLSAGAKKVDTDVLVQVINGRDGTASLDDILIDLYRKHRQVETRAVVSNRLYRLSKRNMVWAVPGRKGVYTTTAPVDGPQEIIGNVSLFERPLPAKKL